MFKSAFKLSRENGMYIIRNGNDVVRVHRQGYAFQLAERMLRSQGIRSRTITKAVAKQLA